MTPTAADPVPHSSGREHIEAAVLVERAVVWSFASQLCAYPDGGLKARLDPLREQPAVKDVLRAAPGGPALAAVLSQIDDPDALDALCSAYVSSFDLARGFNPLYETEWGRIRLAKGNVLADIAAFYTAFGFAISEDDSHERGDHVAVEMEFYAIMLLKEAWLLEAGNDEGVGIVRDARAKFLRDHLGRLVPAIRTRPEVADCPPYAAIFTLCHQALEHELRALDVHPDPLTDDPAPVEGDTVECGACVATG